MKAEKVHIILQSIIVLLSVWLINQMTGKFNAKLDLTEEKRYTISNATKDLLQSLDQEVFFEVYLSGELPPNFERFKTAIQEMLEQFGDESGNKIQYKFTDPGQAKSAQAREQFFQSLSDKGLQPTNLNYVQDGNKLQKVIFPSAIASKGMDELPVNLLKGSRASGPEEILNQSIEGLEYELASVIAQLNEGGTKKVALIRGHGSPDDELLAGLKSAVLSKYNLYDVRLAGRRELRGYDAVIIPKPREKFTENEKYLLDQYLMRGGNLIFFLDALSVNMADASGEGTVAIPYETNLADQLFRYGVRVNQNYVLDINCGQFPVVSGDFGDQAQIQMIPWPFFPLITNFSKHPTVRNLDAILTRFTSTVDTVKAEGIKKTPLASTSQYSKVLGPPVKVAFNDLMDELIPERFNGGVKNIAWLLEGKFTSLYAKRLIPMGFERGDFVEKGMEEGKVIVFADGDLIVNGLDQESGEPLALGVEPYTRTTYANEQFVLNILDYLVDDSGLIETRSREIKLRPLDKVKVKEERATWQVINLVLPVILILVAGSLKWFLRKKKFAQSA